MIVKAGVFVARLDFDGSILGFWEIELYDSGFALWPWGFGKRVTGIVNREKGIGNREKGIRISEFGFWITIFGFREKGKGNSEQ